MTSPDRVKEIVSQRYEEMIKASADCCNGAPCCGDPCQTDLYSSEVVKDMPRGAVTFGCGNPVALASLRSRETVLDLGSGAGLDCFLAAQQVGPGGRVVGVDFTQAMISRATENAGKLELDNVEFRLGDIEALPLEDASVDVVISNCVINLAPDKDAVFREAFRVLRPGGRLWVSDIVLARPATDDEIQDMSLLTGCISGSLPAEEYADRIRVAGFENVRLAAEREPADGEFWYNAAVSATRP